MVCIKCHAMRMSYHVMSYNDVPYHGMQICTIPYHAMQRIMPRTYGMKQQHHGPKIPRQTANPMAFPFALSCVLVVIWDRQYGQFICIGSDWKSTPWIGLTIPIRTGYCNTVNKYTYSMPCSKLCTSWDVTSYGILRRKFPNFCS